MISLKFWTGPTPVARIFTAPVKQQTTLRLDADVADWFKERDPGGRGYQTDINRALRENMDRVFR